MFAAILVGVMAVPLGQTGTGTNVYPRPDLLLEASELAKPEIAKRFRILDTRTDKEWKESHIPLSVAVPLGEWDKQFKAGPDVKWWTAELGRLGIDVETPIVVYGEDVREAARVWWLLRYWGVKDVRILNGGWTAWTAGNHLQAKGDYEKLPFAQTQPKLTPAEQRLATMDQVKISLKDKLFQIIDARSEGEFCGDVKTTKRSGAMPGAVNLEWKVMVDVKTQKFKGAAEMAAIFKNAGIDLTRPTVTHCQSGGRSSVMVFAMELMGAADVRNYYLSWAEWGNAEDTPVVVPAKK